MPKIVFNVNVVKPNDNKDIINIMITLALQLNRERNYIKQEKKILKDPANDL